MASRWNPQPPESRQERIERARVTIAFCEAIYLIHAQSGEPWGSDLLVLKSMQRAALATVHDDFRLWDGY